MTGFIDVVPGRKYYLYGGMQQWVGCGGIAAGAAQRSYASVYGMECYQVRKTA